MVIVRYINIIFIYKLEEDIEDPEIQLYIDQHHINDEIEYV